MAAANLQKLVERARTWPEEAQAELVMIANEIESELRSGEYSATEDELRTVDSVMASIDRGEAATDAEIKAAFARFRRG